MDSDVYDSARRPPPMIEELQQVLRYRDLIVQFVRRDVVMRYKRSVLGVAWTMLNPLGTMIVMTIVFSQLFQAVRSYPAYLLCGLVAWNFFAQTTVIGMRSLVWGGSVIQRIYVPKTLFVISCIGAGLVNLVLALIPLMVVMIATGLMPQPAIIFLPVAILLLAAFALGISLMLSTFAVYFPDVAEMFEIALMAWMYLTPIFYPEEILPASIRGWLLTLNPMYHLIRLFRMPLYDATLPGPELVLPAIALTFGVLAFGWFVFTRKADEFAYRI